MRVIAGFFKGKKILEPKDAKKNILKNINTLNWSGGFYRKDIGYKVIK